MTRPARDAELPLWPRRTYGWRLRRPAADQADTRWDLLLVFVAGYIATAVGRVQQLFPVLMPLKLAFVTAGCAIALYLAQQSGLRRVEALRSRATAAVLLLLLWAALSVPGALNQGVAFHFVTDLFIKTVLLYVLVAGAVRSVRDVERLTFTYFVVATVYALAVLGRFTLGSGDDWRLGGLYYYDANEFATLVVSAIPLGLYFCLRQGSLTRRVMSGVGVACLADTFVRSGSRGGFVAMIAVALFILFGYTTVRARWRIAGTIVIAVVFLATASNRYWTQMQTITDSENDYNRTSETGRLHIWRRGMTYMVTHPLLGVGADNFGVAEGTISPLAKLQEYNIGVRWSAAHNSFVQVGAELGIPGVLFLVTAITSAFMTLWRVARARPPALPEPAPQALAQALLGALLGFVVGAFFLSLAYHEMLYALLGLAIGLGKVAPAKDRAQATSVRLRAPTSWRTRLA
jgi:O-antigen ligase